MNKCPKCGSEIKIEDSFCGVCGTKLEKKVSLEQPQDNTNFNNKFDEELINAYIGKNVKSLKKGDFSPNAFLFGIYYIFYRKMWLVGIAWTAAILVTSFLIGDLSNSVGSIIRIVISVYMGVQFKKMYLKHVINEVDKIKEENPGKTKEELISICTEKGGTTFTPIIIICIILFVMVSILFSYKSNIRTGISSQSDEKTSYKLGDLKYTIKQSLELDNATDESDTIKIYKTKKGSDANCEVMISKVDASFYDNDVKKYITNLLGEKDEMEQKTINNTVWYMISSNSRMYRKYQYASLNNEYIYYIYYISYKDSDGLCSSTYETLIDSLDFV